MYSSHSFQARFSWTAGGLQLQWRCRPARPCLDSEHCHMPLHALPQPFCRCKLGGDSPPRPKKTSAKAAWHLPGALFGLPDGRSIKTPQRMIQPGYSCVCAAAALIGLKNTRRSQPSLRKVAKHMSYSRVHLPRCAWIPSCSRSSSVVGIFRKNERQRTHRFVCWCWSHRRAQGRCTPLTAIVPSLFDVQR